MDGTTPAANATGATRHKVLVYGASSAVGKAIVHALALLGHCVCAADSVWVGDLVSEDVTAVRMELHNSRAVAAALDGCTAVVVALYDGRAFSAWGPTTRYSDAVRTFCAYGLRILATSAGGMDEAGLGHLRRRLDVDAYIDLARMETLLEDGAGGGEHTVVRLPALTGEEPRSFDVVERISKSNFRIGVQDAALFIAREVEQRKWLGKVAVPTYL